MRRIVVPDARRFWLYSSPSAAVLLPAGSLVVNRLSAVWGGYEYYILGVVFVVSVEALLILGLLWQRAAKLKTKAELILTHVRLRSAMVAGKAVGWEWDLKSGRNSWFGDLKTVFGIETDTRVATVEDFYRYVHPEDRKQVSEAVADARKNHTLYAAEFRVMWPDGTLRWVSAGGKFYYSPNSEPERMLGMAVDITDRKQADQALRQSEAELSEAQRVAKVGSWQWDTETDTVTWSEELYRIAGLDPSLPAVSYKEHAKLYTPESWGRLRCAVEEALRTGTPYELDLEMIRFDGATRWLNAKGEARRDSTGRVAQLRGTVHDITERKGINDALQESEERLRLAQAAVHVGVFEWNIQKNENRWSPEMERSYGLTPGSFGSTYEAWIALIHPDDRKQFHWDDQGHVQEGGFFDSEYRIVWPSGEIRWMHSRGTLSCDSAGRPVRVLGFSIDITERKKVEEALRESEGRERARVKELEALLDAAPIAILIAADPECKYITTNRTGAQLHHVPIGTNISRSVPPVGPPLPFRIMRDGVDIPADELPLQRAAATGIPVVGAFSTLVTEDGTERHMIGNAAPLFDEDGKPRGAVGAFVDITERKRAEDALRLSEERVRLAVQAGKMFAYEWDATTDVLVRSAESAKILGIDAGTHLTGQQILAKVHPDDREKLKSAVAKLSPEKPYLEITYRMERPDGTEVWLERNSRAQFDEQGRMLRIVGVVADITERRRAEEALRESEERFRLVADTAPALIWMSGTDKLCTFFNKGWLDFTGRSIESELGSGWAEGVHSEDFQGCLGTYTRAFDAREKFTMEYRLRRYDGEYRWVHDIGVPRFNNDGSFAGFIGSCMDVTERKLAEEALASLSRRLIQAQEQERIRIARELHDDISQRLAILTIELEQLLQDSPDLPAEVHSRVGILREQASSVASDVQSLSHELHSSKLEYLGIAMAMRGFCKEFSDQQRVEIDFGHDDIPSSVPQEVSLCLFRILQEALQNAVNHSGVRHFDVELRYASDAIHLTVRDSGSGFDAEQAMNSRGLGLVSMAERVKLVDGQLSIDSQPQHGTTIHARVPLTKAARASG